MCCDACLKYDDGINKTVIEHEATGIITKSQIIFYEKLVTIHLVKKLLLFAF
jgi:hypothetical protein